MRVRAAEGVVEGEGEGAGEGVSVTRHAVKVVNSTRIV